MITRLRFTKDQTNRWKPVSVSHTVLAANRSMSGHNWSGCPKGEIYRQIEHSHQGAIPRFVTLMDAIAAASVKYGRLLDKAVGNVLSPASTQVDASAEVLATVPGTGIPVYFASTEGEIHSKPMVAVKGDEAGATVVRFAEGWCPIESCFLTKKQLQDHQAHEAAKKKGTRLEDVPYILKDALRIVDKHLGY